MTLCSAVTVQGKKEKGETFGFMAFVLPSNHELSLCQPMSLLAFVLFCPNPTGEGSEREAGWVFGCWPGSTNISFQGVQQ